MGLTKLFPRWMFVSTTLPLQMAVGGAFHCWVDILGPLKKKKIVDVNMKQNLELLNLSILIYARKHGCPASFQTKILLTDGALVAKSSASRDRLGRLERLTD